MNAPQPLPGWSTHVNTKYGYSIRYPEDWICDAFNPRAAEEVITAIAVPTDDMIGCGGRGIASSMRIQVRPLPTTATSTQPQSEVEILDTFLRKENAIVIAKQRVTLDGHAAVEQAEQHGSSGPFGASIDFSVYLTNGADIYRLSVGDLLPPSEARSWMFWISSPKYEEQRAKDPQFFFNIISTFHILTGGKTGQ